MKLTIKYFGMLAELTQCQEEEFEFTQHTISELLVELYAKYPELSKKDFQVAQNQQIVTQQEQVIAPEIALLPPFAGG